jgi:hypothetical protein
MPAHTPTSYSSSHQQLQTNLIINNNSNEKSNQHPNNDRMGSIHRGNYPSDNLHDLMQYIATFKLSRPSTHSTDSELGAP